MCLSAQLDQKRSLWVLHWNMVDQIRCCTTSSSKALPVPLDDAVQYPSELLTALYAHR